MRMEDIDEQIKNAPLSYEEAKEQWVKKTEEFGIKHAYTFDEMWETMQEIKKKKAYRERVSELQTQMEEGGVTMSKEEILLHNPIEETFVGGCYVRKITNPANELIVTKIHKKEHPFFLMKGEMSILTEDGIVKLEAPYNGVTKVGTKRVIYTHSECVFITVHATDKLTSEEVEEEVIAKDFNDELLSQSELEQLKGLV